MKRNYGQCKKKRGEIVDFKNSSSNAIQACLRELGIPISFIPNLYNEYGFLFSDVNTGIESIIPYFNYSTHNGKLIAALIYEIHKLRTTETDETTPLFNIVKKEIQTLNFFIKKAKNNHNIDQSNAMLNFLSVVHSVFFSTRNIGDDLVEEESLSLKGDDTRLKASSLNDIERLKRSYYNGDITIDQVFCSLELARDIQVI